jgi:hypothetical protein
VAPPLAPPVGVLPVWLTLVPFEVTEPAAGEVDVDGDVDGLVLAGVDAGVAAFGWSVDVVVGWGAGLVAQEVPVASAVGLPDALVFAVAEAVAEAVALTLVVGVVLVALGVAVAVLVAVLVAVVLSLVLVLLLAGLVLVLLLAGLVLVLLLASSDLDGEELDGHAVACALVWLLDMLVWLLDMLLGVAPSGDEPIGLLLDPSVPWDPPLLPLWEVIPTAEPICTKAWRSGGTARATPMANTAQAAARPDRSSTSRRSRG